MTLVDAARGLVCLRCLACGRRVWCRPERPDCCHCGSVARAHAQLALRAPPVHRSDRLALPPRPVHRDRLTEIRDLVGSAQRRMDPARAFELVTACRDLLALVDRQPAPTSLHAARSGRPRRARPPAQLGLEL